MADMRKVEEGTAIPEKRKLDMRNHVNMSLQEEKEIVDEDDISIFNKKQKLEIIPEKEKDILCSYTIDEKVVESKDGNEKSKADDTNDKDEHHQVEPEIVNREDKIPMVDKGKGILIEESEEEEEEESDEESSDDSDSDYDFSDGLDTDSEDDSF